MIIVTIKRLFSASVLFALAILNTSAIAAENLECMTINKHQKYSLLAMNLSISIDNSSFDTIAEDAYRLFQFTQDELIKQNSVNCQKTLEELNFTNNSLTNLTNEELEAFYQHNKKLTDIDDSCKKVVSMLFVPALISSIARSSAEELEYRAKMKAILDNSLPI